MPKYVTLEEELETRNKNSMRPVYVPEGSQTADFYKLKGNLPNKFNNPDELRGYGLKDCDPMYRQTSADYGSIKPNVHTMPTSYYFRKQDFTKMQSQGGMSCRGGINL